jgi:hypothetical protein
VFMALDLWIVYIILVTLFQLVLRSQQKQVEECQSVPSPHQRESAGQEVGLQAYPSRSVSCVCVGLNHYHSVYADFNWMIVIFVFSFTHGWILFIAGFFTVYCSVMKNNLFGVKLAIHEIPTCGPHIILRDPWKHLPLSIGCDWYGLFGDLWLNH